MDRIVELVRLSSIPALPSYDVASRGPVTTRVSTTALAIRPAAPAHGGIVGGAAAGGLARLAELCAILADWRNCRGVTPEHTLEVRGEFALIRESGARGDVHKREVAVSQELLRPFDATGKDVLVRRHSGGRLELPREVVGAEVDGRRQMRQRQ